MSDLAITSPHNPRVKEAAHLREHRQRMKQRRFLIDGLREIGRAVDAGVELVEAFVDERAADDARAAALVSRLSAAGVEILRTAPAAFAKVAYGDRAEGVVAVARTPETGLDALVLADNPLVVVLSGVEKPGNIGAVVRSADAAGASACIVSGGTRDLFNPNAIRASLGTLFSLPIAAATDVETLAWLRARGLRVLAARVEGSVVYSEVNLRGPVALVLGSEARGLGTMWSEPETTAVRLPMLGRGDSLNVAAAAAVLLFEAVRQRAG